MSQPTLRALEPGEACEVWLARYDDEDPPSKVVLAICPSARERRLAFQEWDAAGQGDVSVVDRDAKRLDLLMKWVTGWRGYEGEFSRDALESQTSHGGLAELFARIMRGDMVSLEDKKKSESQP